jgi:hypothetical protein
MLIEELEDLIEWNLTYGISKKDTLIQTWNNDYAECLEGGDMRVELLRRYPEVFVDFIVKN